MTDGVAAVPHGLNPHVVRVMAEAERLPEALGNDRSGSRKIVETCHEQMPTIARVAQLGPHAGHA
jgi:hypothetical protein